jgi:hypothetical protein
MNVGLTFSFAQTRIFIRLRLFNEVVGKSWRWHATCHDKKPAGWQPAVHQRAK